MVEVAFARAVREFIDIAQESELEDGLAADCVRLSICQPV